MNMWNTNVVIWVERAWLLLENEYISIVQSVKTREKRKIKFTNSYEFSCLFSSRRCSTLIDFPFCCLSSKVFSKRRSFESSIIYQKTQKWRRIAFEERRYAKSCFEKEKERKKASLEKIFLRLMHRYWHINSRSANKNKIDLWCVAGEA